MIMENIVVVDASVVLQLLVGTDIDWETLDRLRNAQLHAPAHLDAEVFAALTHLNRTGHLSTDDVAAALVAAARLPMTRHAIPELLSSAWEQQPTVRVSEALYTALADRLGAPIISAY
ncbi:type II toxin-antitoxin system VapC family toxin [Skermania sp. ID1734]|uniref:type II toxin-antitoxin system VapC family toxin n=1 Tax=Skermania sp. ID1734 TaxID=2597516 RepID=UPI00117CA742|nr:type II toxin-antitoxin system VapC family toxin [Skermania sp. ID1734]TSD99341.1 type II toxin-antitoxin system VapC family toxin [Skermania sp. ID1734]